MGNELAATLISMMVLAVIVIGVVMPTTGSIVDNNRATSTVTNEEFNSAGGVAYSVLHPPINSISNMYINVGNTTTNGTYMVGANHSEIFVLNTPLDTDGDENYNITVVYNKTATTNVSVYANGVFLGNLSTVGNAQTDTWSKNTTGITSPLNITFSNGAVNLAANISSVAIGYLWMNTTTNYTHTTTTITPAPAGTYKATYTYFTASDVINNGMFSLINVLIGVALIVAVVGALILKAEGMI